MKILPNTNNFIGVDLGSTSIKIVELKRDKDQLRLVNYGFSESDELFKIEQLDDVRAVVKIIRKILSKSGIRCNEAFVSLPTFSVFTSLLNLSNVAEKDLASAVHWEAKKLIPLPLEEMIIDWKIVSNENSQEPGRGLRVLLVGAPKALVKKYNMVFREAGIQPRGMETETFSLVRSLIGNDKTVTMIVELGASTTDVSIVEKGIPMLTRSIDVGGATITQGLSTRLNVKPEDAEQFKFDLGVGAIDDQSPVSKMILEILAPVLNEIKYSMDLYASKNQSAVNKIILSGGSASLPELPAYLSKILDKSVLIGNPWDHVSYQVDLKPLLEEIGPRMSVAVGLAMYGFSK